MSERVRVSLATKCQLLFGAAVVLILAAALSVVWLRMQALVERGPYNRARDLANTWLADRDDAPVRIPAHGVVDLPPGRDARVVLVEPTALADAAESDDEFLTRAEQRFRERGDIDEYFDQAADAADQTYWRYAQAIRDRPGDAPASDEPAATDTAAAPDARPLQAILLVDVRDPEAAAELMRNRIYIVAAGLAAGVLAIAVFWYITTRLILSPVRVLRDYAQKVSEGHLNIRADVNTGDEFQQLSDMFNHMLDELRRNEQQLRAINKSMDIKLGELAEANVSLYETNKVKDEFLANVSHELRTPLNSIVGFAEVLQETLADRTGPVDEKRKRYVANIIDSSRRLLDLINDLLDLAKIEAGRMELYVAPTSVSDLCEGLMTLMKPQADQKKLTLHLRVEPKLPVIQTDAGKLQQILFNFLANAVKFTPADGRVSLTVEGVNRDEDDQPRAIRFKVSDTGPGIAKDDQQRVFEKFTQLAPSATREFGGTGLGLTISRELADLLGGKIELDSTPGKGATFSLTIPVEPEQRAAPLMPSDGETASPARTGSAAAAS